MGERGVQKNEEAGQSHALARTALEAPERNRWFWPMSEDGNWRQKKKMRRKMERLFSSVTKWRADISSTASHAPSTCCHTAERNIAIYRTPDILRYRHTGDGQRRSRICHRVPNSNRGIIAGFPRYALSTGAEVISPSPREIGAITGDITTFPDILQYQR